MTVCMSREQTLQYMLERHRKGERLVVSRYSDGEFNIFTSDDIPVSLQTGNEDAQIMRQRLTKAIRKKNQLVCINELKERNLTKKDRWVFIQEYLKKIGGHDLYGGANWNVFDYTHGNNLLPRLFSGKTLIVTGHDLAVKDAFRGYKNIGIYKTELKAVSTRYDWHVSRLRDMSSKYDNIIFACGPAGKAMMTEIAKNTHANLIDIGAVLNAIIHGVRPHYGLVWQWSMSWAATANLPKQSNLFFSKIRK